MRRACLFLASLAAACGGSTSGASGTGGGAGLGIFTDCGQLCSALADAPCGPQPIYPIPCLEACPAWREAACTPWKALVACAGPDPQIICVASSPYIVGCQNDYEAVRGCTGLLADGGSSDAGAACRGGTMVSCECPDHTPGTMYCLPGGHLSACTCGDW